MAVSLKIKIIGNACIIRYNNGEQPTLKAIIDTNYAGLTQPERTVVISYVGDVRPDIPYETGTP